MRSSSITRQIVLLVLLAQIACAAILSSVTVWHEWHGRIHALDVQIAGHNDSLLGAIQDAEDPEDNIGLDPQEVRLPPEDFYAVYAESGKLVGRSVQGPLLAQEGPAGLTTVRLDGQRYRVLRRRALRIIDRAENGGVGLRRPVAMVYAAPMANALKETVEGVAFSLTSIALAAGLTAAMTTWLLRRTLRPVHHLAVAAQRVSPSSLQFEPPVSAMQLDELRPLATTLSTVIDELRVAFAKEQRFVGDAAHELKTAVAVVRSTLQLLMMRPRSEAEYVEGLEQVLLDNDRVENLVSTMLDLARVEQSPAHDAPLLDLGVAVRGASDTMRSFAEARGVRIVVKAETDVKVSLQADRAQALLTNLLSNAILHSDPEQAVTLSAYKISGDVMINVKDVGSGIRAEALPHVFERFYRDDPSRSRLSGGTGLGLAICKSIVEAAGGTIHIDSVVAKGTTVSVLFRKA